MSVIKKKYLIDGAFLVNDTKYFRMLKFISQKKKLS